MRRPQLLTAGCTPGASDQWGRWGLLRGITQQSGSIGSLWNAPGSPAWSWRRVWGLIGYAVIKFRRKHATVAKQNQYNVH